MVKLSRRCRQFISVGVLATLAAGGCGLKGPLYHPGQTDDRAEQSGQPNSSPVPRKKSPFEKAPAPQAQKQTSPATLPPPVGEGDKTSDAPVTVDPDRPATPPTP